MNSVQHGLHRSSCCVCVRVCVCGDVCFDFMDFAVLCIHRKCENNYGCSYFFRVVHNYYKFFVVVEFSSPSLFFRPSDANGLLLHFLCVLCRSTPFVYTRPKSRQAIFVSDSDPLRHCSRWFAFCSEHLI